MPEVFILSFEKLEVREAYVILSKDKPIQLKVTHLSWENQEDRRRSGCTRWIPRSGYVKKRNLGVGGKPPSG